MALPARVSRVSFAGGELSKTAAAREDFARYEISVERLENMIVMQEGGLTRCPGTRFVLELKDQTKPSQHITFRLSTEDYYTLILNGGKARLVRAGGFVQNPDTTPYEFDIPWTDEQLDSLRSARDGNTLYVTSSTKPYTITRSGHTSWATAEYVPDNGPVGDQNLDVTKTVRTSAATGNISMTGANNPFSADMVGGVMRIDDRDLSQVAQWMPNESVNIGGQRRYQSRVYEAMVTASTGVNPPTHDEGDVSAGNGMQTWRYLHDDHGLVRITAVTNGNTASGTVIKRLPDSIVSGASFRWYPPAWSDVLGWPSYVFFDTPRLGFLRGPQIWETVPDLPNDHERIEGLDDEAFVLKVRASDGSLVDFKWAAKSGVTLLGTPDQEWSLRGPGVFDKLTPNNAKAIEESTNGSSDVAPTAVDGGVIYVGRTGKRLHFGSYLREEQRINGDELTRFARHLFKQKVAGTCWQRDPHRVLWIWFVDGTIASLTWVPSQEILAFARRPMANAFVEKMSCVPSVTSGTDEVTLTVRRTIAGQTKRYIEQFAEYYEAPDADNPTAAGDAANGIAPAWYLDCALRFTGLASNVISGLGHLRGQRVGIMADGAMLKDATVQDDGTITLERTVADAIVGIPQVVYGRDLPRNLTLQGGSTKGLAKNAHEATIQLDDTGGLDVRVYDKRRGKNGTPDNGIWDKVIKTGSADYDEPIELVTGVFKLPIGGNTQLEAQIEFRAGTDAQANALPLTILALSPKIEIKETS